MMILSFALMLAAADLPPERPVAESSGVRVHRKGATQPKEAEKAAEPDGAVKVHKDKTPDTAKAATADEGPVTEYHSDPVFSADIAFQRCLEAEADRAAKAEISFEDFKRALPNLCVKEETRLAQRYADSKADGDPMRQIPRTPRSKSRALVFDYTEGLRGVVEAGYINLTRSRAPMRLDKSLTEWKPR